MTAKAPWPYDESVFCGENPNKHPLPTIRTADGVLIPPAARNRTQQKIEVGNVESTTWNWLEQQDIESQPSLIEGTKLAIAATEEMKRVCTMLAAEAEGTAHGFPADLRPALKAIQTYPKITLSVLFANALARFCSDSHETIAELIKMLGEKRSGELPAMLAAMDKAHDAYLAALDAAKKEHAAS